MLVPILNEFQVLRNDEKKCDEKNQEEDNFEINFKNAETIEEHFQIKLKIILPKCWKKSCSSIYQLFSLKFYITFNVPPIIVKRILSPE